MNSPSSAQSLPPARGHGSTAYLDLLRCLAMALVIALHCTTGYVSRVNLFGTKTWWACNWVNSFARMGVPLFLMISGYLQLSSERSRDLTAFYKNRICKLAIPFLVWDVIYFLETCCLNAVSPTFGLFFKELVLQGSKYHLWFIYQILGIYLLTPFLKKIVDHSTRRELWVFLAVVLLQPTFLRFFTVIQSKFLFFPFSALVEGYVGFYLAGYLLGTGRRPSRRSARRIYICVWLAGIVVETIGNYRFSSPEKITFYFSEGYSILQYLNAGALFLLVKESANGLPSPLLSAAGRLSRLTFGIYFSHVLVLDSFGWLAQRLYPGLWLPVQIAASFVAVCAASTALSWGLSKVPGLRRLI